MLRIYAGAAAIFGLTIFQNVALCATPLRFKLFMMKKNRRKDVKMIDYAKQFIGVKYKWGGESADEGFDCSGFVQEVLRAVNLDPPGDQTAQALYDHFSKEAIGSGIQKNSILFFGNNIMTHVAIALNDKQMIEAGGEGRTPTSRGMVRVRPILSRKDFKSAIILPIPKEFQ